MVVPHDERPARWIRMLKSLTLHTAPTGKLCPSQIRSAGRCFFPREDSEAAEPGALINSAI